MTTLHQHDLSDFLFCRRKFDLHYNKGYSPKVLPTAFIVGGMFADAIEQYHNGVDMMDIYAHIANMEAKALLQCTSQKEIDIIETRKATIMAMVTGYDCNFDNDWESCEPEYRIEHQMEKIVTSDYKIICRLDGFVIMKDGTHWVMELKTASQLRQDTIEKLPLNFQILLYNYTLQRHLNKPVSGVIYRHIKKPTIRIKKSETPPMFQDRIMKEYMNNPEKYYNEEHIYFDTETMFEFEQELYDKLCDLDACYRTDRWYKNEINCTTKYGDCMYMPYCINPCQETLETYFKQEDKL